MSFSGLHIMRTALQAQQRAMQVIGHNVANAQTTGYTRQTLSLAAADPSSQPLTGGGEAQFGTGVREAEVVRYRNDFLDRQYRNRSNLLGYYDMRQIGLNQLELVINEPTDAGIRVRFDDFWEGLQSLNNRPSDLDTRVQFRERAKNLVEHLRFVYAQYQDAQRNYDTTLIDKVSELNLALKTVAGLNERIAQARAARQNPADLMDRRDLMLDKLSQLVGVKIATNTAGDVQVWIGTELVISGVEHATVQTTPTSGMTILTWEPSGESAVFPGGELAALQELRDRTVPDYIAHLDQLTQEFAARVNAVHNAGYALDGSAGLDLFTIGPGVMNVELNAAIMADSGLIAAAKNAPAIPGDPAAPGDGGNAFAMLQIRDETFITGGLVGARQVTANDFIRAMGGLLGVQSQEARRNSESYELQVSQANEQRMSVSGVSLDEEMTRMVEHQTAFNAAARVITALDEMLDHMVTRVGLVGR